MLLASSTPQKLSSEEKEKLQLPLVSLITFSPIGNPMDAMTNVQREFFFSSLFRMLQRQNAENEERVRQISGKLLPPVSVAQALAMKGGNGNRMSYAQMLVMHAQKVEELRTKGRAQQLEQMHAQQVQELRAKAEGKMPSYTLLKRKQGGGQAMLAAGQGGHAQAWQNEQSPMPESALGAQGKQGWVEKSELMRRIVFRGKADEVKRAQAELCSIINDYSRGNAQAADAAISEFSARVASQGYKADELSAVLLLVIEDIYFAGEEGDVAGARPGGAASKVQAAVAQKISRATSETAEIRLASVREMLRYYFQKHPEDYRGALAMALGMSESDADNDEMVRAKFSSELAQLGAFALSQKLLAAIKQKRKMDSKKCLLELGYKYDKGQKKLIIGKRTCGKPAEARGIVSALLSKFKKPK